MNGKKTAEEAILLRQIVLQVESVKAHKVVNPRFSN